MLLIKDSRFRYFKKLRTWSSVAVLSLLLGVPGPVSAETLKEALAAAYLFNPTLKGVRAQLRATDNVVANSKSGYRPTVTATLTDGFEDLRTRVSVPSSSLGSGSSSSLASSSLANGTSNPRSAQIALQQNVFDGFRTYNAVQGPEALVD